MTAIMLTALSVGCSSDDGIAPVIEPPIIDPPIETNLEKAIQNEWVFTNYNLLDKDKKVLKEFSSKEPFACKESTWIFKEEIGADNTKENVRIDKAYLGDVEANDCEEYIKSVPYTIKDKELVTVVLNDGDQLMLSTFEIQEISKNRMLLIDKSFELTDEEIIEMNYPKGTRYLQYAFTRTK